MQTALNHMVSCTADTTK